MQCFVAGHVQDASVGQRADLDDILGLDPLARVAGDLLEVCTHLVAQHALDVVAGLLNVLVRGAWLGNAQRDGRRLLRRWCRRVVLGHQLVAGLLAPASTLFAGLARGLGRALTLTSVLRRFWQALRAVCGGLWRGLVRHTVLLPGLGLGGQSSLVLAAQLTGLAHRVEVIDGHLAQFPVRHVRVVFAHAVHHTVHDLFGLRFTSTLLVEFPASVRHKSSVVTDVLGPQHL